MFAKEYALAAKWYWTCWMAQTHR